MKADILAIGVHPDDVELSCSGTIAKHVAEGKKVVILDLTRGELGTRGNAELRTQEAMQAAKILGVMHREQLHLKDGFFQNTEESVKEIITQIRRFQPEIVLCNAVSDRHPDHGRSAQLEADACFYSGLRRIETYYNNESQQAWRPKAVYHYIQDEFLHPDFVIDVTAYADIKKQAILAFSSQFWSPDSKEPATPISGEGFLDVIFSKMRVWGRAMDVPLAEGFQTRRYPGVRSLFDLV